MALEIGFYNRPPDNNYWWGERKLRPDSDLPVYEEVECDEQYLLVSHLRSLRQAHRHAVSPVKVTHDIERLGRGLHVVNFVTLRLLSWDAGGKDVIGIFEDGVLLPRRSTRFKIGGHAVRSAYLVDRQPQTSDVQASTTAPDQNAQQRLVVPPFAGEL